MREYEDRSARRCNFLAIAGGRCVHIPCDGDDSRTMICGKRPTVIDDNLDDYGAAYPGFIILNTRLLSRVSTPIKLWIFSHECGHQFRGPDEETGDCFAVQRGRREGWLSPDGLEEICGFISATKGESMHFAGSHRCEAMRVCYADPSVR